MIVFALSVLFFLFSNCKEQKVFHPRLNNQLGDCPLLIKTRGGGGNNNSKRSFQANEIARNKIMMHSVRADNH